MAILIGADVGGSKTAVGISEPGGPIVSRAEGPGASVRPGRALASAGVIAEVVRRALAGIGKLGGDVMVVGAAGAGRDPERTELQKALRAETLADTVVVTTDIEIALEGAFEGPGIVVSAGTGSIAVGRDRQGKRRRIGGYGWQMGDEGSGYGIGRAALGAVSRAYDGRSPRTALTDRVLEITRSADFDALVRWAAGDRVRRCGRRPGDGGGHAGGGLRRPAGAGRRGVARTGRPAGLAMVRSAGHGARRRDRSGAELSS